MLFSKKRRRNVQECILKRTCRMIVMLNCLFGDVRKPKKKIITFIVRLIYIVVSSYTRSAGSNSLKMQFTQHYKVKTELNLGVFVIVFLFNQIVLFCEVLIYMSRLGLA